jgi:acyl dehydratase
MTWLSDLKTSAAGEIGTSGWMTVSQQRIDRFAEATDDFQFIHTDPERAVREAPFGGTIAHGMLTLSLISTLALEVLPRSNALKSIFAVAVDKVKFITPLRSGKRVRGVFKLDRTVEMAKDRLLLRVGVVIEIESEAKPALTCDVSWIAVLNDAQTAVTEQTLPDATVG